MKKKANIGNILILTILCSIITFLWLDRNKEDVILSCLNESSVIYKSEGTNDYWQTVQETESLGTGDCEDMALLLYTKLKKKGFNPIIRAGIGDPNSSSLHMWIELEYKGTEYILDPTGNAIFEKRDPLRYIAFPQFMVKGKLMDWEIRNRE